MKKLFSLIVLLCATLFAQQARAASYQVWIAGTQVTDANKSNLYGTMSKGSVSGGIITFDSSNNVLTIPAGTTISAEGDHGIKIGSTSITIKFGSGTVTINSDKNGIRMDNKGSYTCTLEGNNTTSSNSVSRVNIYAGSGASAFHIHDNCTGVINNLYFWSSRTGGAKFGIDGRNGSSSETLTVKGNSRVELNAGTYAIGDMNYLYLQDNHEFDNRSNTSSYGAYFKKGSDGNVYTADGNTANYCDIDKATTYGFSIGGYGVNDRNVGYIGAKLKNEGVLTSAANTVSYVHSTKTLTFNGATLKTTTTDCVYNPSNSDLIINFAGTNNLTTTSTSDNVAGFYLNVNTTVQGTGTLNLTSSTWGVRVNNSSTLTFKGGLTATIKGTNAVRGWYTSGGTQQSNKVVFDNVTVTMTATSGDVCSTFGGGIELTNCDVVTTGQHVRYTASTTNNRPGYGIGKNNTNNSWTPAQNTTVVIKNAPSAYYPVAVAGRRLNSNNYQNISWEGISGTLTYVPSTATLTLSNATISNSDGYGMDIYSGFKNLSLTGTNKITSKYSCIELNGNGTTCNIYGAGSLELSSTTVAIRLYNDDETLTVNCASLKATGSSYGIYGRGSNANVTLTKYNDDSDYSFLGTNTGSIVNITNLTLNNMSFCSYHGSSADTQGASFHKDKKAVCYNGGAIAKGTIHFDVPTEFYNIWIGGTQLNNCNRYYFGSPYITAGGTQAVRYNASDNTLYLAGATITNGTSSGDVHGAGNPISSSQANLTIKTTSASNVQTTDGWYYPLYIGANTTFTGDGKLTVSGHSSTMRVYNTANITFKDANVSFSGSINTASNTSKIGSVVVDNSTVSIGNQIYNANSVTWKNGTELIKPQGGHYDATAGFMKLANGNEAYGIEFGKPVSYGLTIDGTDVTNANNTDPTGDGSFSYDPNTKTLTVKKSYTGKSTDSAIINNTSNGVEDLVINFTGSYTLMSATQTCIRTEKNTTIKSGSSSYNIVLMNNSTGGDGIGQYGSGKTLTLDNVKMTITAPYGIFAYADRNDKLVLKKCDLTITSTKGNRCVGTFSTGVEQTDCGIYSPTGGKFIDGAACDKNGNAVTTTLVINQQGTGIEAVVADDFTGDELNVDGVDNAEGIYDLNGRRLNELQRGVNIVRRRDGSTVKVVKK